MRCVFEDWQARMDEDVMPIAAAAAAGLSIQDVSVTAMCELLCYAIYALLCCCCHVLLLCCCAVAVLLLCCCCFVAVLLLCCFVAVLLLLLSPRRSHSLKSAAAWCKKASVAGSTSLLDLLQCRSTVAEKKTAHLLFGRPESFSASSSKPCPSSSASSSSSEPAVQAM